MTIDYAEKQDETRKVTPDALDGNDIVAQRVNSVIPQTVGSQVVTGDLVVTGRIIVIDSDNNTRVVIGNIT